MPLDDRDYVKGYHSSTCNCVECTNKRLGRVNQSTILAPDTTPTWVKVVVPLVVLVVCGLAIFFLMRGKV